MSVIQYIFQVFLKAALLGAVLMLAWFAILPISFSFQELALYYINLAIYPFLPYNTLLAAFQTAAVLSETTITFWILDPMASVHHRIPIVRNDEQRAEDAEEGAARDWKEGITGEAIRDTLSKIEEDIENLRVDVRSGDSEVMIAGGRPARRGESLIELGDEYSEGFPPEDDI